MGKQMSRAELRRSAGELAGLFADVAVKSARDGHDLAWVRSAAKLSAELDRLAALDAPDPERSRNWRCGSMPNSAGARGRRLSNSPNACTRWCNNTSAPPAGTTSARPPTAARNVARFRRKRRRTPRGQKLKPLLCPLV